jgi:hypothetical protein
VTLGRRVGLAVGLAAAAPAAGRVGLTKVGGGDGFAVVRDAGWGGRGQGGGEAVKRGRARGAPREGRAEGRRKQARRVAQAGGQRDKGVGSVGEELGRAGVGEAEEWVEDRGGVGGGVEPRKPCAAGAAPLPRLESKSVGVEYLKFRRGSTISGTSV